MIRRKQYIISIIFIAILGFSKCLFATTGKVTADTLKLRKNPSLDSTIIELIDKDKKVNILEETGDWYKVSCVIEEKTYTGYVSKQYVTVTDGNVKKEETSTKSTTEETTKSDTKKQEETKKDENKEVVYDETCLKIVSETKLFTKPLISSLKVKKDNEEITLKVDETFTVISKTNNWFYVKNENYCGWVNKIFVEYLQKEIEKEVEEVVEEAEEVVEQNQEVKNKKEETNTEVTNRNLSTSRADELRGKVVATAKEYLGCPYVYGATGPNKFDCSGFTYFVLNKCGINVDRTLSGQMAKGTKVDKKDLKEGDLIIFNENNSSNIGHIGIYIGNNKFIHACSWESLKCEQTGKTGKMVKITDLNNSTYVKRYNCAIRIIK